MKREEIEQAAKDWHIRAQFRPDTWHDEMAAFAIAAVNQALEEAATTLTLSGIVVGTVRYPLGDGVADAIRALKIKEQRH